MSKVNTKSKVSFDIKSLELLGLSDNEILLYSNMLQMPRATVKQLGTLGLFPRTMLYHVLNQLIGKALVEAQDLVGTKTIYIAKDPENLYQLLHKKEVAFKQTSDSVKELIPKLKNQFSLFGKIPNIRVFNGILEYEKALEDIFVSRVDTIYAYENFQIKKTGLEARNNFENRRILKKIKKDVIFFEIKESLDKLANLKYNDYTNYRGIAEGELKEFQIDLILYSNKLLYTLHDSHEPMALLIEDRNLYEMQMSIFQSLYNSGKNRTLYYTEK